MKQNEIRSSVGMAGGVPTLFVNGRPFAAAAYETNLLEENPLPADPAALDFRPFEIKTLKFTL